MIERFLSIDQIDSYVAFGMLLFFIIIESLSGYLKRTKRTGRDWMHEAGGLFILAFIKIGIVAGAFFLGRLLAPGLAEVFSAKSLLFTTCFYLFIDDIMQYWYHRSAHEYEFLWKLHRPHHQAEEMGFFIAYRNSFLYYVMMPNLWWGGICIFLGGGMGVALGLILKQFIIVTSHSTISYDKALYKSKILKPFVWVWEHIFITPAFHHAHHGASMLDGSSDPNGNFGNMFSIWDQLFGSAKFTHAFPEKYGLMNDPKEGWAPEYLYPLVTSKNMESELSRGYVKEDTRTAEPAVVNLVKGEKYLYCACGKSKNQPFCDGTHHGSKIKPLLFEVRKTGEFKLCNCKANKQGPFCDDSHLTWTP